MTQVNLPGSKIIWFIFLLQKAVNCVAANAVPFWFCKCNAILLLQIAFAEPVWYCKCSTIFDCKCNAILFLKMQWHYVMFLQMQRHHITANAVRHYPLKAVGKIKISKLNKKTNYLSFSIFFFSVARYMYTGLASVRPWKKWLLLNMWGFTINSNVISSGFSLIQFSYNLLISDHAAIINIFCVLVHIFQKRRISSLRKIQVAGIALYSNY